jgi:uncharacterized Ntn-hydrolase superfamily protein
MKRWWTSLGCGLAVAVAASAGVSRAGDAAPARPGRAGPAVARPVHTYSIVARDSLTGELGVAVQSHWFSVGAHVAWAEAGVGAVATQSFTEISYGPLGLSLMRAGKTAPQALAALTTSDPQRDVRQVAMVDAQGRVAAFTGQKCIAAAGDRRGAQYSVQANLMEKDTVWDAMARAYETTKGDLAERLLAALEAAQKEGGDIRGKQSAAILIVPGTASGRPWADRVMELRVEDHAEPVQELRRLVGIHRAYERMDEGDRQMAVNNLAGALEAYAAAAALLPDNPEVKYWAAVTMITAGREKEALAYFKDVFAREPKWVEVTRRLPASGLLPDDPALVEKIVSVAPKR